QILQGRKLEEHRKIIAARRAEINKELERIPVRIDEVQKGLQDLSGIGCGDKNTLAAEIARLRALKQTKEQERARLESGGEIAEKVRALRELEAEILNLLYRYSSQVTEEEQRELAGLSDTNGKIVALELEIKSLRQEIASNNAAMERLEVKLQRLRDEWYRVNSQAFEFQQDETCPTCGQRIPQEKLDEARERALAQFNLEKARKLEAIAADGRALRAEVDSLRDRNAALEEQIRNAERRLALLEREAENRRARLEAVKAQASDISAALETDPAYLQKLNEKVALEQTIEALKAGNAEALAQIAQEIEELEDRIGSLEQALALVDQYERSQRRIEELKEQERRLAAEYERLEEELYLTEQFIRAKVQLLEKKINSRFKLARFKLFDVQVNGAVVECCETLYKGVPYSSLNHGAQINVGLDIINTLTEHYGFAPPIFVDNAEAVTQLIPTRAQLIRLVVSGQDKALRVERLSGYQNHMKEAV
ncbi:MAG TPA: hypothetical protein GX511_06010, partial [Firmicutes bacterium]|nr:hypothetical protein [Bacillota bacterium]